jgi:hypothetical protein
MRRVCIDNNILIWGVRGDAGEGQKHMIKRARLTRQMRS